MRTLILSTSILLCLLHRPVLSAENMPLDRLVGDWVNIQYLESINETKSPCMAAGEFSSFLSSKEVEQSRIPSCNAFFISRKGAGCYEWKLSYIFHEGAFLYLTGLRPGPEAGAWAVDFADKQTHGRDTTDDILRIPGNTNSPINGVTWEFTTVHGKPPSRVQLDYVRAEPTLNQLMNVIILAGTYRDGEGRLFTFDETGEATWPEAAFSYAIELDPFWTNASMDCITVVGEKFMGRYPMRYGFELSGGKLLIFKIRSINNDTTVEFETNPLYVLIPQ